VPGHLGSGTLRSSAATTERAVQLVEAVVSTAGLRSLRCNQRENACGLACGQEFRNASVVADLRTAPATDPYIVAWDNLARQKRTRRWLWLAFIPSMIGVRYVNGVASHFPRDRLWLYFASVVVFSVAIGRLVYYGLNADFCCPRCGKRFFQHEEGSARRDVCGHCGIAIGTPQFPDRSAPPPG
jgi:hypothetical protein